MRCNFLIYFLLLVNVLMGDTYWFFPFILSTVLLVFPMTVIGFGDHLIRFRESLTITKPFLFLISYILIVQIFRGESMVVSAYTYVSVVCTILTALYFKDNSKFLVWYLYAFLFLNVGFQFIQMFGLRITAGNILGPLGFKSYAEVDLFDSTRGLRYSGLFTNVVPLAFFSGVIAAYFWILYDKTKLKKHLLISAIALLMAVLTNTRAVIYFIIPVIFLTNYIVWKRLPVKLLGLCLLFLACMFVLQKNTRYDSKKSSMNIANWQTDGGIVDRIQGNVYGTVGTLRINPLFGVSEVRQGEAITEGHRVLGLFFGTRFINHVTYHNLPLYYLRVYGIIGLLLFIYLNSANN